MMSKKSKSKKAAPAARTKLRAGASAGTRKALAGRKGPRSQVLPGMEQVRSRKLDNLCEAIAECRAQKNAAVTEEKSLDATALQVMVGEGLAVYRHGGVELARIPGAEKLRVRMTREEGDAGDADLKEPPELDIEPEG